MNQRIKKLAEQAGIIKWGLLPSGAITPDHESVVKAKKFAELIIQECASIFEGVYTDQQRPERIDTRIKEHFGIKNEFKV